LGLTVNTPQRFITVSTDSERRSLTWSSTRYHFDSDNNLVDVGPTIRWYVKDPDGEEQAELYKVEHEMSKPLFVLTGPDGQREHFRDNPARQLLVEPDPSTG
jgi:hypothetical protein